MLILPELGRIFLAINALTKRCASGAVLAQTTDPFAVATAPWLSEMSRMHAPYGTWANSTSRTMTQSSRTIDGTSLPEYSGGSNSETGRPRGLEELYPAPNSEASPQTVNDGMLRGDACCANTL